MLKPWFGWMAVMQQLKKSNLTFEVKQHMTIRIVSCLIFWDRKPLLGTNMNFFAAFTIYIFILSHQWRSQDRIFSSTLCCSQDSNQREARSFGGKLIYCLISREVRQNSFFQALRLRVKFWAEIPESRWLRVEFAKWYKLKSIYYTILCSTNTHLN